MSVSTQSRAFGRQELARRAFAGRVSNELLGDREDVYLGTLLRHLKAL